MTVLCRRLVSLQATCLAGTTEEVGAPLRHVERRLLNYLAFRPEYQSHSADRNKIVTDFEWMLDVKDSVP